MLAMVLMMLPLMLGIPWVLNPWGLVIHAGNGADDAVPDAGDPAGSEPAHALMMLSPLLVIPQVCCS